MPYADRIAAVYRILNTQTGDCYVGQSQNVKKRLAEHLRQLRLGNHVNPRLQRAYKKYGPAAFVPEIEVVCDVAELDVVEEAFLSGAAWFDSPCVYNISDFAKAPMRGKTHSPEVRQRISEGRRRSTFDFRSDSYRATLAEAQRRRALSNPEFVARVRYIVENGHLSYAERGRVLGMDTGSVRKLALKYSFMKGEKP